MLFLKKVFNKKTTLLVGTVAAVVTVAFLATQYASGVYFTNALNVATNVIIGGDLDVHDDIYVDDKIDAHRYYQDGQELTLGGLWEEGSFGDIYYDNGDVAIGRASPSATLDVDGDTLIRDDLDVYGDVKVDTTGTFWVDAGSWVSIMSGDDIVLNADGFMLLKTWGTYSEIQLETAGSGADINLYSDDDINIDAYDNLTLDAGDCYGSCAADIAESIASEGDVGPGDVVVYLEGKVAKSTQPYDKTVVGVISTSPTVILRDLGRFENGAFLAISGIVPCKVTNENGVIEVGDLLTSSSKPGYAMRCAESQKCFGTTIGKALEGSDKPEDTIFVIISLN